MSIFEKSPLNWPNSHAQKLSLIEMTNGQKTYIQKI